MAIANVTNKFGVAKWIVDPTVGQGTHTTIDSAYTSASSGDTIFVRPGTYTENPTIKAGVNLVGFVGDGNTPTVTVVGKFSASYSGTATISNIRLQTNSDNLLTMTGSNATILNLNNCYLNVTNNAGFNYAVSSTSSRVNLYNCVGDLSGSFAFFTFSGTGITTMQQCFFTNSANASTAATQSAGIIAVYNSTFFFPWSISSTGAFNIFYSQISTVASNSTSLTLSNTSSSETAGCRFISGTATPLTVNAGTTFIATDLTLQSTNAASVSGSGSLTYNQLRLSITAGTIAPTTTTKTNYTGPISFNNGTTVLDTYVTGTFTPVSLGTTTTGVGTYTYQVGRYQRMGNMLNFSISIAWTAHTGTGQLRIQTLPYTVLNLTAYNPVNAGYFDNGAVNDSFCYAPITNTTRVLVYLRTGTPGQAVTIAGTQNCIFIGRYEV